MFIKIDVNGLKFDQLRDESGSLFEVLELPNI